METKMINSENVHIFPFAKNRPEEVGDSATVGKSRRFFEDNVANFVRQLIDVEGFIISTSSNDESIQIVLNVHGYYIELSGIDVSELTKGEYLYILVKVQNGSLFGQDTDGSFEPVIITTSTDSNIENVKSIVASSIDVPEGDPPVELFGVNVGKISDDGIDYNMNSFMKFNYPSLNIVKIDGNPL